MFSVFQCCNFFKYFHLAENCSGYADPKCCLLNVSVDFFNVSILVSMFNVDLLTRTPKKSAETLTTLLYFK